MSTLRDDGVWLSAHLYFQGELYSTEGDRVVLAVVKPFVRGCQERNWIERYFFVRYSDPRPHIRLRVYGPRTVISETVQPALRRHVLHPSGGALDTAVLTASRSNPSTDGQHPISDIRWVPYEPEVERYGGADAVAVAENHFHSSSETCADLLEAIGESDRAVRLGKALLCMVTLAHAFCRDRAEAASFISQYGTSYLRSLAREESQRSRLLGVFESGYKQQADHLILYVNEAWRRLESTQSLSSALDLYHHQLRDTERRLRFLHEERRLVQYSVVTETWQTNGRPIANSYLHMMSNRMGVTIPEESYLSYVMNKAMAPDMANATSESRT